MTLLESARFSSSLVTRHADFLLVGMVVAVITLMVVPLPTFMVDLLISANLGASFVIMMMTMYAPNVLLDPACEEKIRQSIRQTSSGAFLALDPDSSRLFLQEVRRISSLRRGKRLVIICSIDIRRYVRRLIEGVFYEIPVLDYQELTPEISVQPVDRIRI